MDYETIIYKQEEGIADLIINRPDKMNAISFQVVQECLAVLEEAGADADVKVVVVSATGEKAFSAGDDVGAKDREVWYEWSPGEMFINMRKKHFWQLIDAIRGLRKPVIAAVQGWCLGSAPEVVLACDIVFASETARFGVPLVNLGVPGTTSLLARAMGYHRACEFLFTGDHISAREAEAMGMVNHVVAPEELQNKVREMALKLARQPTHIIGWTKWALNKAIGPSVQEAIDYEVLAIALTHSSRYLPSAVERREGKIHPQKKQDAQ